MIVLTREAFEPGAELSRFCADRRETGAVVSFIGLARGRATGETALVLDAYEGFTEIEMERFADQAVRRFGLQDVQITHRIGPIGVGEAEIVMVLTAAEHRRASPSEACDFLMDYLKSRAPLWKQEPAADGPRWIEPTAADLADGRRWDEAEAGPEGP